MKATTIAILALTIIGLLFVAGCATGQASYTPPSGPVGGGCGVGAPAHAIEDPCSDAATPVTTGL
jgi:hypothetical protein